MRRLLLSAWVLLEAHRKLSFWKAGPPEKVLGLADPLVIFSWRKESVSPESPLLLLSRTRGRHGPRFLVKKPCKM